MLRAADRFGASAEFGCFTLAICLLKTVGVVDAYWTAVRQITP